MNSYNAGDVVVIDFPGVVQTKRRPVVVVSSSEYHQARPDCIVGILTSQVVGATAPTDYNLQDWQAAGLRLPSTYRSFLHTLPRTSIITSVGKLSEDDWQQVRECVRVALGF